MKLATFDSNNEDKRVSNSRYLSSLGLLQPCSRVLIALTTPTVLQGESENEPANKA